MKSLASYHRYFLAFSSFNIRSLSLNFRVFSLKKGRTHCYLHGTWKLHQSFQWSSLMSCFLVILFKEITKKFSELLNNKFLTIGGQILIGHRREWTSGRNWSEKLESMEVPPASDKVSHLHGRNINLRAWYPRQNSNRKSVGPPPLSIEPHSICPTIINFFCATELSWREWKHLCSTEIRRPILLMFYHTCR